MSVGMPHDVRIKRSHLSRGFHALEQTQKHNRPAIYQRQTDLPPKVPHIVDASCLAKNVVANMKFKMKNQFMLQMVTSLFLFILSS